MDAFIVFETGTPRRRNFLVGERRQGMVEKGGKGIVLSNQQVSQTTKQLSTTLETKSKSNKAMSDDEINTLFASANNVILKALKDGPKVQV